MLDEVFDRANQTYYGLAAAIWTKDIDKAHPYAKHLKAGTVWVNCYHIVDTQHAVWRVQDVRARPRER